MNILERMKSFDTCYLLPLLCLSLIIGVFSSVAEATASRVVILTDISPISEEPDDAQSLVRLLLYANELNIQGLISNTSVWRKNRLDTSLLSHYVRLYGQVRGNLTQHATGYPTQSDLESKVKAGNLHPSNWGMAAVGAGSDSAGSHHIISVVDASSEPTWFLFWGGGNTLAQAVWRVKHDRSSSAVNAFIAKLRVYDLAGQDDTGSWLVSHFPAIFYIRSQRAWAGISPNFRSTPESRGGNEAVISSSWIKNNIQNHGVLGQAYPNTKYRTEGDSPTFLYLLPNGLEDVENPGFGSWGSRYKPGYIVTNYIHSRVLDKEAQYYPFRAITDVGDHWVYPGGLNNPYHNSIYATVFRWREAFQNDMAARMDWTVQSTFNAANHPPTAHVGGNLKPIVSSGAVVSLDASGSSDPDGNNLSYNWMYYPEAGTFGGSIAIHSANSAQASFITPTVTSNQTIHMILSVRDNGSPSLTRYKRLVITVTPDAPPPQARIPKAPLRLRVVN